jgi:hypothetical protein
VAIHNVYFITDDELLLDGGMDGWIAIPTDLIVE